MDIVQNINNIIKDTPYTLTELERICEFPKSSMRKWSENIPSISKVAKVADVLNVSLDYLYFGEEKSSPSELSEEEQELLFIFKHVSERERGELIGYARRMIETSSPESREDVS